MASDVAIPAQDEVAPISAKDDTTVPTAEELAVTPETSHATQAEPAIEKVSSFPVSVL